MLKKILLLLLLSTTLNAGEFELFKISDEFITSNEYLLLKETLQAQGVSELSAITTLSSADLSDVSKGDLLTFRLNNHTEAFTYVVSDIKKRHTSRSLFLTAQDGVVSGSGVLTLFSDGVSGDLYIGAEHTIFKAENTQGYIGTAKQEAFCDNILNESPTLVQETALTEIPKMRKSSAPAAPQSGIWTYQFMPVITKQLFDTVYESNITKLEEAVNGLVDGLNLRYINSDIPVRAALAHYVIGDGTMYQDPAEPDPYGTYKWFSKFLTINNIDALRHQYKADVVTLFVTGGGGGNGGLNRCNEKVESGQCRWWNGSNISRIGALYHMTTAHEIGHNMGLVHSFAQNEEGVEYKWGRGHGVNGMFVTQMAYRDAYSDAANVNASNVPYFSNPDIYKCRGRSDIDLQCGVEHDKEDSADAASAITAVLPYFTTAFDLAGDMEIAHLPSDTPLQMCAKQIEYAQEHEDKGDYNSSDYHYDMIYSSQITDFKCENIDFSSQVLKIEHLPYIKKISLKNLQLIDLIYDDDSGSDRVSDITINGSHFSGDLSLNNRWIKNLYLQGNDNISRLDISGALNLRSIKANEANINGHVDLSNKPGLTTVDMPRNPHLSSLNLSNSNNIKSLALWGSNLQGALDLSHLHQLKNLNVYGSDLTSLKLASDALLDEVFLWGNKHIPLSDIIEFKNIKKLTLNAVVKLECWQENILRSENNITGFSYSGDGVCTVSPDDSLDSDRDGIINVNDPDDDNDGLNDLVEVYNTLTDPRNPDSDNDRIPDAYEVKHQLNPNLDDADIINAQGISNYQAYIASLGIIPIASAYILF